MQKYRRVLALILTFSLLFGMSAFPTAAVETVVDMPSEADWSYAALKAAMDNDLLRGSGGKLQPETLLTRSQLAAVVVRAFGARTASVLTAYTDVAPSAWYHDDMARAVAMGVLNGSGGQLRPEDGVTRQEAFVILARAMKLSGGPASALASFSDRADVAPWAEDAMASLLSGGYIQGNGGRLNPAASITRAEFAQVMYKLISSYIDKAGVYDKAAGGTVMVRASGVKLKGAALTRDLILGDGIGSGDATLDSVTVAGRTVIRGGGVNSILAQGNSSLGAVIIDRPAGGVALKLQDKAAVGSITICSNGVALYGIPKGTSVTVNKGVTGASLEGAALPEGVTTSPGAAVASGGSGSSGGGGNPSTPTVATTAMTISPAAMTQAAGTYAPLTVTRNSGANDALAWSSSDETVAIVDANGRVGTRKSGQAIIAVQSPGGVVAAATVYVQEPAGTEITISVPGTVLTGGSYTKITVAASVGTGDYTLNGVTVGTLETHGGGIHSGHIVGGSVDAVNIQDTPDEGSRVLLSGGAVVGTVTVAGAADSAALEVAPSDSASVGGINSAAPLTVTNTAVTGGITSAGSLALVNSSAPVLTTSGASSVPVTLDGSSVGTLNAGVGGTSIAAGTGGVTLPVVNASGPLATAAGVDVGKIDALNNSPSITASGPVGSITGTAGAVSLNNSGGTLVEANAGSVSVSGASAPVISGTVPSVTVAGNPEASAGVTVLAGSPAITTTGAGAVGQISVGGSAAPTITANAPVHAVTVADSAAPTVGGSAQVGALVSTSSGTTTVGSNTAAVLATNTATVNGANAQPAAVTLQSIAVTNYPTKLNYAVGGTSETPNTSGMVVTGHYTVTGFDGTVSKVLTKDTDYTVGAVDLSTAGTKPVTATASGKTAYFTISVVAKVPNLVAVTKLPTKLVYEKGEGLDLTGGKLTVVYTDSALYSNEEVDLTAVTVSGYNADAPGVQTLTATYSADKKAAFTAMVKDSLGEAKTAARNELNTHAAVTLASALYSATSRGAIETARKNGEDAIGAATDKIGVNAALGSAKAIISNTPNQAAEWNAAASSYRMNQFSILSKITDTVTIADKAAVNKALVDYAALEVGVQTRLTAEKAKLDGLLAKIAVLEAAQTLDAAKATATATLNTAYEGYNSGYTANHGVIETAKDTGLVAINSAAATAAVTAALDKALADMAAVKSDAALLAETKTAKLAELSAYAAEKSKSGYDATGKAAIETARKSGEDAINTAENASAASAALSNAKAAIDAVKTTAQIEAEKLLAAKMAAKAELATYGNPGLYSGSQKTAFDSAKDQGAANIDAAATAAAVASALSSAKATIDALKTDAQLTAEELVAAKTDAKNAIKNYKTQGNYLPAGWALVTNIVGKWQAAVDACTLREQVTAAVDMAKAELNTVTTVNEPITRADIALSLYYTFRTGYGLKDGSPTEHPFTDIGNLPAITRTAISFCYNNKFIAGTGEHTFGPDSLVTRAAAAAVLSQVSSAVIGAQLPQTVSLAGKYTDVAQSAWYYDCVIAMGRAGVFPADTLFRPDVPLTAGEHAATINALKTKLDPLCSSSVQVISKPELDAVLHAAVVKSIKLTGNITLDSTTVLEAGKTLIVGAGNSLIIPIGGLLLVDGTLNTEAGSTIRNDGMILISGGVFNNAGIVEGRWVDDPNSQDAKVGWYESSVVTDVVIGRKLAGAVNNTGEIRDTLQISDYLADTPEGDVKSGFTNKVGCPIARLRPTALIKTTAALKRALANPNYAEIDVIGSFTLSESVTVPEFVQLFFPKAWEEDGVRTETSLAIPPGVTLTVESNGELCINCATANNAGAIVNNGYLELNNGTLNITGAVANSGYLRIQDYGRVTGGSRINNMGTVEATSVYATDKTVIALDGCAGSGELRHTAYVYDGSKLVMAAENQYINSIWIVADGVTDKERTVTMSGSVTLRPDVSLFVTAWIDDDDPSATRQPVILVIPGGASLTVGGEMGVPGMVEVQAGGALTLNGSVTLREKRNESYTTFGTLKNAGSVTLGSNAVLDCGGDIISTGSFTNHGEIRSHPNSGTAYPRYGTVTGVITGNQPVCVAIVKSEGELRAALADDTVTNIRITGRIDLATHITIDKRVDIADGESQLRFNSADAQTATLTVGKSGWLEVSNGGRLVIGDEENKTASAPGSVVNNGSIVSNRGQIWFVDAEEWSVLTGNPVTYYANRADLVRMLGQRLSAYMEQPGDGDFQAYGATYTDWGDMFNENPDWNDNDAIDGYALLLKNEIGIAVSTNRLEPYGDLTYAGMKNIFSEVAVELLGENYSNAAMTDFLNGITETGVVTYRHQQYIDGNNTRWDNSLSVLTDAFIQALGMYRADVSSMDDLAAALGKTYVTEIHIAVDLALPAGSDDEQGVETKLTGTWGGERTVTVDTGSTLTIPQYARLTVEQGVTLVLNGKLVNSGGMDVFGRLQPDNWDDSEHYEKTKDAYINFYPDFLDLANRLHELSEGRELAEVTPSEIPDSGSEGWPNEDLRGTHFAFLVKYGGVQRKSENGHSWWPSYDKVTYGELKGALTHMYQAICKNADPLPVSVKLDYDKNDAHFVSDEELSFLLNCFASTLPGADAAIPAP